MIYMGNGDFTRYDVIAIEREYASGGREISGKLAEKLNLPLYGQEILELAADKLNLPLKYLSEIEESIRGSLLFTLAAYANVATGSEADILMLEQKLAFAEADIIRNLSMNPCVILGRGAAALLRDKANTLRVFIHADYKTRIDRAVGLYGIDPKQSESTLRRHDKRRANYFVATTDREWKDADIYHLFINSGMLGIDQAADILCAAVR